MTGQNLITATLPAQGVSNGRHMGPQIVQEGVPWEEKTITYGDTLTLLSALHGLRLALPALPAGSEITETVQEAAPAAICEEKDENAGPYKDIFADITKRIIVCMEQGVVPWKKPWSVHPHINMASMKEYQGVNQFILNCTPFSSPVWLSWQQAADLGGEVKKGAKAMPIIFWKKYEQERTKRDRSGTYRYVLKRSGVFNIEQCGGIHAPDLPGLKIYEHDPIDSAESVILSMPNRPTVTVGGQGAYYLPCADTVNVPEKGKFVSAPAYYSTFFHELGHSTGHKSRLSRNMYSVSRHSATYSKEELIAELTSSFLCGKCRIEQETLKNSAAYINGWIKYLKDHQSAFFDACIKAQQAARYILGEKPKDKDG
jgi:antirestriction protein ArdC